MLFLFLLLVQADLIIECEQESNAQIECYYLCDCMQAYSRLDASGDRRLQTCNVRLKFHELSGCEGKLPMLIVSNLPFSKLTVEEKTRAEISVCWSEVTCFAESKKWTGREFYVGYDTQSKLDRVQYL